MSTRENPKIIKTHKVFDFRDINGRDGKPLRHGLYMHRRSYLNGNFFGDWIFASRNEYPSKVVASAVIVVARVGNRAVVTKEFRIPLEDHEYGFPAGILEQGTSPEINGIRELREETGLYATKVYPDLTTGLLVSSAGLSDEATQLVFMDAEGEINYDLNEPSENIQAELMDIDQVCGLLYNKDVLISDKTWGIMNGWNLLGRISFGSTDVFSIVTWNNKKTANESFQLD